MYEKGKYNDVNCLIKFLRENFRFNSEIGADMQTILKRNATNKNGIAME